MQKSVSNYKTPESQAIIKYVRNVFTNNRRTGTEYRLRLVLFESFIKEKYPFTIDDLVLSKVVKEDVYDLLSNYIHWLTEYKSNKDGFRLSPLSIRQRVDTARTFLECYDIEISPRKFKLKVKLPRTTIQYKQALTKDQIINILNACDSLKLKVYLLCLASTGIRASEAAAIRNKDIDFKNSKLNIRAEYAKTRVGRYVFLTQEMKSFFSAWLDYKYRVRKIYLREKHSVVKVKPDKYDDNLVFSTRFDYDDNNTILKPRWLCDNESDHIRHIYTNLVLDFNKLIKRLNVGYESVTQRRHIYTFHSFRRFVKSTISDLGYSDFSEWYIGHAGSTYYRRSDKEKFELFKKIEPYLTFLDQSELKHAHADLQTRLESLESENLELKKEQEENRLNMVEINKVLDRIRALESSVVKGQRAIK